METQKVALVTGAAGVMGRAVVKMLIDEGHVVVIADVNRKGVEDLGSIYPETTLPAVFDASDFDQSAEAMRRVEDSVGAVDILVNNAGVFSSQKALELTPDEWHRVMAVNLDSAFYMCKLVLPGMRRKRWGRIVNVSSYGAKSGGITAGTAYAVSKGAMATLTFSIAGETTHDGITVNAIAPAWVRTPMVTNLSQAEQEATLAKIPVGRFCEPEEFAHVVRFLVSPLAGFITGELVDLNGGVHFD